MCVCVGRGGVCAHVSVHMQEYVAGELCVWGGGCMCTCVCAHVYVHMQEYACEVWCACMKIGVESLDKLTDSDLEDIVDTCM